mmetsp:Transcript_61449/g.178186  ORF Transcript_61449/g.178186 Transcript_61449/m.178186 type:complete len:105 (-) Transcript_61449:62-376(-)
MQRPAPSYEQTAAAAARRALVGFHMAGMPPPRANSPRERGSSSFGVPHQTISLGGAAMTASTNVLQGDEAPAELRELVDERSPSSAPRGATLQPEFVLSDPSDP